ncbi:sugar transferase [Alicyclobacillus sp.]|uniref:sugar transferase n=1 Tax=Alicyclobacillus sp. TaxID=61169 RepID=UPI0025C3355A|nr:sugar transferase [Alicyclobacillus sp.]
MSLVGPRLPLPDKVDLCDIRHRRRLSVKLGITFLWQISGRNNERFHTHGQVPAPARWPGEQAHSGACGVRGADASPQWVRMNSSRPEPRR